MSRNQGWQPGAGWTGVVGDDTQQQHWCRGKCIIAVPWSIIVGAVHGAVRGVVLGWAGSLAGAAGAASAAQCTRRLAGTWLRSWK